ncbi:MAG: hypothetical protein ACP5I4_12560, partial [Oceanipulchritudo sp.]
MFLLDWNFHYTVNDHLGLFATVSNLLDETHLASRHPHGPRPGAPRQVVAGLTLVVKGVVIPRFLMYSVDRLKVRREVEPLVGIPASLLI